MKTSSLGERPPYTRVPERKVLCAPGCDHPIAWYHAHECFTHKFKLTVEPRFKLITVWCPNHRIAPWKHDAPNFEAAVDYMRRHYEELHLHAHNR